MGEHFCRRNMPCAQLLEGRGAGAGAPVGSAQILPKRAHCFFSAVCFDVLVGEVVFFQKKFVFRIDVFLTSLYAA